MKKPNLESASNQLHPSKCYDGLIEIEKLLKHLSEINSGFTMNKTELMKKLSIIIYGEESKTFSRESNFGQHFIGLNAVLLKKAELLNLIRNQLNLIERETVLQEEVVGSLKQEIEQTLKTI